MQLEQKMLDEGIQRKDLAKRLNLTQGRVSQILNGKLDNFSVEKIVAYAHGLEMDVAIVGYQNESSDLRGPIHPDIFRICWERLGKPQDFFDLEELDQQHSSETNIADDFYSQSETSAYQVEIALADNVRDFNHKRQAAQTDSASVNLIHSQASIAMAA